MFKNIFYKLKDVIVAFGKMSLKQSEIVFMNFLHALFSKGMFFFAFYFVFVYNPYIPLKSNVSGVVILGVAIVFWALLVNTLKDYKMQYVTPYRGAIIRGLFDIKYLVLVGCMFYYFNLVYSPKEFYIYICIVTASLVVARLCEARKIKILGKDWLLYESTRK